MVNSIAFKSEIITLTSIRHLSNFSKKIENINTLGKLAEKFFFILSLFREKKSDFLAFSLLLLISHLIKNSQT